MRLQRLLCYRASRPMSVPPVIDGVYRVGRLLGEGGMGQVWLGEHRITGQKVAIKALAPELCRKPKLVERFIQEARMLASLDHPNVVGLVNFVEEAGQMYLLMQYVEGRTLGELLELQGQLPIDEAVDITRQVLAGLTHAHAQGMVHRDIKPENVIVRGDGVVKVADFGVARIVGSSRMTQTGLAVGTVQYMSPEQIKGEEVDGRSDLYSVGVTLYEALCGHLPFPSDSDFEVRRAHVERRPPPMSRTEASAALRAAIDRSLEKSPDRRFQSASEFSDAIEAAGTMPSTELRHTLPPAAPRRPEPPAATRIPPLGTSGGGEWSGGALAALILGSAAILALTGLIVALILADDRDEPAASTTQAVLADPAPIPSPIAARLPTSSPRRPAPRRRLASKPTPEAVRLTPSPPAHEPPPVPPPPSPAPTPAEARGADDLLPGPESGRSARKSRFSTVDGEDAPQPVPDPEPADSPESGAGQRLSKGKIQGVVRRSGKRISRCAVLLPGPPGGKITVDMSWHIQPSGRVTNVVVGAAPGEQGAVGRCVARAVRGMRFPSFEGKPIKIGRYPFGLKN